MADLRELMTDAKRLYEALEDLTEKQDEIGKDDIDLKEIWQSAKNRPFKNHMLSGQEYSICRKYLGMLSCIVALSDDGKRRTVQIRFMARILSACYGTTENDIRELLTDGMLLNEKGIEEFKELENKDLQTVLAVDMLILCYLCGEPEEKQLDFAVGFMAMLGLDRDTVKAIGTIAKGILEQDDSAVLGQVKYASVGQFYCYMKNSLEGITVIGDFSELELIEADNVMLVNVKVSNKEDVINLDNYGKKKIIFYGCCFEHIAGIHADKTKVEFQYCKFFECNKQNKTYSILYINKGGIFSTTFEQCSIKTEVWHGHGEVLSIIYISNGKIKNCKFIKCEVDFSTRGASDGQIVRLMDSSIESSIFIECSSFGRIIGGWSGSSSMDILFAIRSNIDNNQFKKCKCGSSNANQGYKHFILACDDYTSNKDNIFEECSSSQSSGKDELIGRI